MIHMNQHQQRSEGDNSPNIDGNGNHIGDNHVTNIFSAVSVNLSNEVHLSNEVQKMAEMIKAISAFAQTALQEEVLDTETNKDLEVKLKQRFSQFEPAIRDRYSELFRIYGTAFQAAWDAVELRGITIDEITYYLRKESSKALETEPHPIKAMEQLANFLESQLERGTTDFSRAAIEFFVYNQFVQCNVFPNPKEV